MAKKKSSYKWSLYKPSDRKHYLLKVTFEDGRVSRKSTGKEKESEAKNEVPDLLEKILGSQKNVTEWQKFVGERKVQLERLGRSPKYIRDWTTVAYRFEECVQPHGPEDITQENIDKLIDYLRGLHEEYNQAEIRERERAKAEADELRAKGRSRVKQRKEKKLRSVMSDSRINGYIALLKASTRLAVRYKMIEHRPFVDSLQIPIEEVSHGRALTKTEVETFFSHIPDIIGEKQKEKWIFMVYGLLYSGFRISEAWSLSWDDRTKISIDNIDGEKPMFIFPLRTQKSKKRQLVPLIPEMIDLLRCVPLKFRTGPVFRPHGTKGKPMKDLVEVGKKLSSIGKRACVVVEINDQTGEPIYASAHDFRRTFADLIMDRFNDPRYCQKLMRHATLETTMRYYAIKDVEEFAEIVQKRTEESDLKHLGHTSRSHENLEVL